jgi:hypothetical protein
MRLVPLFILLVAAMLVIGVSRARADSTPTIDLPYGIGSVQLPWSDPEVLTAVMKPIKGGLVHEVYGFDYNIITIGKLSNGYRIIDGLLGGVLAVPNSGAQPDAYGSLSHDLVQDIPALAPYATTFHIGAGVSYSNAAEGWLWGGGASYTF